MHAKWAQATALAGIMVIAVFTITPVAGEPGSDLWVFQRGGSDTDNDCRDIAWPCRTITHALGLAEPGDTVWVSGGDVYDENLVLDKNGLTLRSGPDMPKLWPSDLSLPGLLITADDVALIGFVFQDRTQSQGGDHELVRVQGNGARILHNIFEGRACQATADAALVIRPASPEPAHAAHVVGNDLRGGCTGIDASQAPGVLMERNWMNGHVQAVAAGPDNRLLDNVIRDNLVGVSVPPESSGVVLSHNRLYGNAAGVENQAAAKVDARHNWWGSTTGPTAPWNPLGSGDPVLGPASWGPWCIVPQCTDARMAN